MESFAAANLRSVLQRGSQDSLAYAADAGNRKRLPACAKPQRHRLAARASLRWLGCSCSSSQFFIGRYFTAACACCSSRWPPGRICKLDVQLSGNIFTNLTVEKLRATPTGRGPTPVRHIDIDRVHLDYSLPMLVRHGVGEFLQSYEVRERRPRFRSAAEQERLGAPAAAGARGGPEQPPRPARRLCRSRADRELQHHRPRRQKSSPR